MLELLFLLGLAAYLIAQARAPGEERLGAAHDVVATGAARGLFAPPGALQQLTIADTVRPQLASDAFVRTFGLDPRDVRDIRMYARGGPLETFPPALAALLLELHREGCVVGAETAAVLFRGRALRNDEALYFALAAGQPMPRIVAFLDTRR